MKCGIQGRQRAISQFPALLVKDGNCRERSNEFKSPASRERFEAKTSCSRGEGGRGMVEIPRRTILTE